LRKNTVEQMHIATIKLGYKSESHAVRGGFCQEEQEKE
jgi:hypothetical protein